MFEKKRQHPIIIFTHMATMLKDMIIPFLLTFVLQGVAWDGFEFDWVFLLVVGGIPFLILGYSFLRWYFYRFSYSDGVLNVYYGVLIKRHKQIKRERVQTISLKAGLIFRLFKLISISIETAGGKGVPEFKIDALPNAEAETLKRLMKDDSALKAANTEDVAAKAVNQGYKIAFFRLFAAALTSGDIGPTLALLSVLYSEASALLPYETLEDLAGDLFDIVIAADVIFIIIGVFLVLILTVVISTLKFMFSYANFSVERSGDEIVIKRGLIEIKQIAFKLHRIHAVTVVEGLLRQPFGFSEVRVNVVGDFTQQNVIPVIHPFMRLAELQGFFDKILPGVVFRKEVNKLPKRSLRRYLIRGVLPFVLFAPAFFFIPYGYFGILIYPPLVMLAVLRFSDAGYLIKDSFMILRFRRIARTTAMVSKNRIQSITLKTNYFQKLRDLKTINVKVHSAPAATTFSVKDISADCGKVIWNWFS